MDSLTENTKNDTGGSSRRFSLIEFSLSLIDPFPRFSSFLLPSIYSVSQLCVWRREGDGSSGETSLLPLLFPLFFLLKQREKTYTQENFSRTQGELLSTLDLFSRLQRKQGEFWQEGRQLFQRQKERVLGVLGVLGVLEVLEGVLSISFPVLRRFFSFFDFWSFFTVWHPLCSFFIWSSFSFPYSSWWTKNG